MAAIEPKISPLLEYCEGAVAALRAQYDMTKVLGHSATAGAARESLIQNFLTEHLPEMTTVVSGVIVDSGGQRSKQQDIVLMLKSMPRLRFASGHDLIFQEGAVATFEIKTSINAKSEIEAIGRNIESVRCLIPTTLSQAKLGDLTWPRARILTAILTYNGALLSKIEKWLVDLPESNRPDIYFDLSKGILLKNENVFDLPQDSASLYFSVEVPSVGLARFLTILAKITGVVQIRGVEWKQYIGI